MNYQVRYLREVRKDIQDAWLWYENHQEGRGDIFVEEVEAMIEKIGLNPFQFPIALAKRRKAVMADYPYVIYFEIVEPDIIVIAVFHSSRNPTVWQNREEEQE